MNCVENILDKLRESRRLNEMAIINPTLCKSLTIQVEVEQRDEGPIPHFHIYLGKGRNPRKCAYVRIDKAEYSAHHKEGKKLDKTQKEEFLKVMTSIWDKEFIQSINTEEVRKATGYEAAVKTWIDTFGETVEFSYDDQGFPIMPDYDGLLY